MDFSIKILDTTETITIGDVKLDFFFYAGEHNNRIFSATTEKERLATCFYHDGNEYGVVLKNSCETEILLGVIWSKNRYLISVEERKNS